jgi:hypothetical protein
MWWTLRRIMGASMLAPVLILALAGCGKSPAGNNPISNVTSAPSGPTITPYPTETISPTPSPTLTAYAPPCAASQLKLTAGQTGAALGHLGTPYQFTNMSTTACSLKGYASARTPGHTVKLEKVTRAYMWLDIPINTIQLPPGGSAYFLLQTDDVPISGYQCFTSLVIIYPPRSSAGFTSEVKLDTCDGIIFISPIVGAASDL